MLELNSGPLQEQYVFLTNLADPPPALGVNFLLTWEYKKTLGKPVTIPPYMHTFSPYYKVLCKYISVGEDARRVIDG